jgi:hypothetical protein
MFKKIYFLFVLALPLQLFAQNNVLTGNVFDNDNRATALEGATIRNLTNKSLSLSAKDGHFAIAANIGDYISFGRVGYQSDTVYITKLFPKNIYLLPQVNNLSTVNVNSVKLSPYLNFKNPDATPSRAVDYSKDRGGLRLNLGYGKFRKEQFKIQELEENQRYEEEISKNFNEEAIKKLLNFEIPDVKDFISLYRPTVGQLKAERPFNYAYYTAKAYHAWLRLPPDQRKLPSLLKLKN